jgi:hypothetical protein
LYAQLTGVVALLLLALGVSWLIINVVQGLWRRVEALRSGTRQSGEESDPTVQGEDG